MERRQNSAETETGVWNLRTELCPPSCASPQSPSESKATLA